MTARVDAAAMLRDKDLQVQGVGWAAPTLLLTARPDRRDEGCARIAARASDADDWDDEDEDDDEPFPDDDEDDFDADEDSDPEEHLGP